MEDIHDQASLDQYWREHGGRPYTVAEEKAIEDAERDVIGAAILYVEAIESHARREWRAELTDRVRRLMRCRRAREV